MPPINAGDDLPLERIYRWERERAGFVFLTQPLDGGRARDWTWSQAAGEARRMAAYLLRQGWEPGSRIAIVSRNCAWWILADMAIWMAGHVSVPIYPALRADSIRRILEHSEARACFLGATDDPGLPANGIPSGVPCIFFATAVANRDPSWEDIVRREQPMPGTPVRPPGDLATILYTSGTTGEPKGVMHRFSSFSLNARAASGRLGLGSPQRFFSYLPLAHIVERVGVETVAIQLGSQIFFTAGPSTFLDDLRRARPTVFLTVPRLLQKYQQEVFRRISPAALTFLGHIPGLGRLAGKAVLRRLGLETVRHAACGAAPLSPDLLGWFRGLGLDLIEGYGMTESMITHLTIPGQVRPGHVGPPLDGVEARIGDGGELQIHSPVNMLGYFRDAAGTSLAFTPDGYLKTGDIATIDPGGQLKIVGRLKEQFKTSKGKYVAPAPIESRLAAHPGVDSCCLMGAGQPSPFAIVVLSEEARKRSLDPAGRDSIETSLGALLHEVNAQLEAHERVALIAVVEGPWSVENGLMTPTFKLRRAALEGRYQPLIEQWKTLERPVVWSSAP